MPLENVISSQDRLIAVVRPTLQITGMKRNLASLGRVYEITQIGGASNLIF